VSYGWQAPRLTPAHDREDDGRQAVRSLSFVAWPRADDVRALVMSCVSRTAPTRRAETLKLILDVYDDAEVTRWLAANFDSAFRRPLAFHLAQAKLSFQAFREVGELLRARLGE
jgi:hypothetical protein